MHIYVIKLTLIWPLKLSTMILWSPLYIVEEILLIFMGLLSFSRVVVNSVAVGGWQGGGERVVKGWFGYSHFYV